MNIKIANRLVKLRKEKGLSQEELADKLGISRQSVSKWERAESSPDTDNLICLAKLYGVSLDELLKDDENLDDLAKKQKEKNDSEEKNEEEDNQSEDKNTTDSTFKKTGIHIGDDGIHCYDKDGNAKVSIDDNGVNIPGIHINISDEDKEKSDFEKFKEFTFSDDKMKRHTLIGIIEGVLSLLSLTAYLLIGFLLNDWLNGIALFFIPFIIGSFVKCISKKRFSEFNISFLVLSIYIFLGTYLGIWHPLWVIFLLIPIYYTILGPIDEYRAKKLFSATKKNNENGDTVIDINI